MSADSKVFLAALVVYLVFYLATGGVIGRRDLTDVGFHLHRGLHPLSFLSEGYYAPLLHFIIWPLTLVVRVELAASLVAPAIIFLLCPLAYVFFAAALWERDSSDFFFLYLFGSFFVSFNVFAATWSQALNLVFVLLFLGLACLHDLFKRGADGLWADEQLWCRRLERYTHCVMAAVVAVGFFSHSDGGFYLLALYLYWLLVERKFLHLLLAFAAVAFVLLRFNLLVERSYAHVLEAGLNLSGVTFSGLLEVVFVWLNPIIIYYAWRTLRGWDRPLSSSIRVLRLAVVLPVLLCFFDSQFRPLLFTQVLCSALLLPHLLRLRKYLVVWHGGLFILYLILFLMVCLLRL